jgi:hypothetical protein
VAEARRRTSQALRFGGRTGPLNACRLACTLSGTCNRPPTRRHSTCQKLLPTGRPYLARVRSGLRRFSVPLPLTPHGDQAPIDRRPPLRGGEQRITGDARGTRPRIESSKDSDSLIGGAPFGRKRAAELANRTPSLLGCSPWPTNREVRCALRSDYTDARYSQGAQCVDTEHLQAGSCQITKDHGRKPGVRLLARSKRGTRFRSASLLGGIKQRGRRFCSLSVGRHQGTRRCWWRSPDDRNWR